MFAYRNGHVNFSIVMTKVRMKNGSEWRNVMVCQCVFGHYLLSVLNLAIAVMRGRSCLPPCLQLAQYLAVR